MSDDAEAPGYPTHWEADVVLRDGGTAHVRPIRPADAAALQAFHLGQSERSTYFRFFAPLERLPERDLHRFTHVDHRDRVALVAVEALADPSEDGLHEQILAVARYERTDSTSAEVAFNVSDRHQGRGLGSVLLEHLAAAARERGIARFTADVLPANAAMLAVFREAGYVVEQRLDDGILSVAFEIDPTERSLEVMADREHRAEARSVRDLLTSRSVLVVTEGSEAGPSSSGGPGGGGEVVLALEVARHLQAGATPPAPRRGRHRDPGPQRTAEAARPSGALPGAQGTEPPPGSSGEADPSQGTLALQVLALGTAVAESWPAGVTVHRSMESLTGEVDLLVLAVPPERAPGLVRRLARLRPRAAVVLSGGFAETGPGGLALQRDLLRAAHTSGLRLLGPASYGFFRHGAADGEPTVNASLAASLPSRGRLALFCQSSALAVGMLASARRRGLGLSTFLSSGNRADVSGNDAMQFWTDDDATDVVALSLESIGNPRKFTRVARRLAAVKPVVVLTAGRSGHVLPAGHAVRLTRAPRRALEEMLRQSGVVRVHSVHQLLDVSQLLTHQPLPAGPRVAVLASSESLAALVAEAATSAGLQVTERRAIATAADRSTVDHERLESDLADVYATATCDAVVVVHVPVVGEADERTAQAVARAAARAGRTTVACILGLSGLTPQLSAPDRTGEVRTVPAYAAPEDGVAALAAAVRYAAWRAADHGAALRPTGVNRGAARRLVEGHLARSRAGDEPIRLDADDTRALLGAYGVDVVPSAHVQDVQEAIAAAERLGWPVALKSTAEHLRHRLDLGGVRLGIRDAEAMVEAWSQMTEHLLPLLGEHPGHAPFEVQRMVRGGAACVVRSGEDPRFGPVVSFGLAGDAVDLLDDVSHGIAPLTDADVRDMVRRVRAAPRLLGYRGLPALDVAALEDLVGRVAVMADDLPELHDLELNPVVVAEHGLGVLGARATLALADRADRGRRVLPA